MEPTSALMRVGDLEIHYLFARPPGNPRGVLVALHGGGVDARYYDRPGTGATMFAVAPAAGWLFVAPHRPGYPPTSAASADRLDLLGQAATIASLIAALRRHFVADAPVVLQGHSFGAMLAIAVAATTAPDGLVGLDVNGAGVAYRPRVIARLRAMAAQPRPGERRLHTAGIHHPVAAAEFADARGWESWFPELAPDVGVPVRYTMTAGDEFWEVDDTRVRQAAALFRLAPWVDAHALAHGGHALEEFPVAQSFRAGVVAFAERARRWAEPRSAHDHRPR